MSTLEQSPANSRRTWHLIALGAALVLVSLLLAGWLLVVSNDIPGGFSTLLLTVAGALFIAIGRAESSRQSA